MGARRGAAMLLALLVLLLSSAIAGAALSSAQQALQRAGESQAALRETLARDGVRARLSEYLAAHAVTSVVNRSTVMAPPDTMMAVDPLGLGWYRVSLRVGPRPVSAELGYVADWAAPCEAAITGATVPANARLGSDPATACPSAVRTVPLATFDSLAAAWARELIALSLADTVELTASTTPSPTVWHARAVIRVGPGATISGVLWAPTVTVGPGASVTGVILARDRVSVDDASTVIGGALVATEAWERRTRLRLLGRRGLLNPP